MQMNFPVLLQAGTRELLPQLQAARQQLSDGEGTMSGSMAASPSKVSPAAWQHGCGSCSPATSPSLAAWLWKLFTCHQPFPGTMQGKAGTDRASVSFNGPYCPELALTMHQGEARH